MIEIKAVTQKDDIEEIVTAINDASWSDKSEIDQGDYSVERLKKCISNQHQIFCIAFLDDKFSGMASAFVLHKPDGDVMLYIDEIDVCLNQQQKGVGKAIMQFLFNYAQKNECDDVWLGTEKDNVAANALYKAQQPSEIEEFVGYTYKL